MRRFPSSLFLILSIPCRTVGNSGKCLLKPDCEQLCAGPRDNADFLRNMGHADAIPASCTGSCCADRCDEILLTRKENARKEGRISYYDTFGDSNKINVLNKQVCYNVACLQDLRTYVPVYGLAPYNDSLYEIV